MPTAPASSTRCRTASRPGSNLNTAALDGSDVTTLLRETTKAWVAPNGPPVWLRDGSFVWNSERTGWQHLYHYRADGTLIRPITAGEWDVRTFHGVADPGGWAYFSGTERSYIGGDVYRIKLDGTGLTRLSQAGARTPRTSVRRSRSTSTPGATCTRRPP